MTTGGSSETCIKINGGRDPHANGTFWRGKWQPIVKKGLFTVSCAKTAVPIKVHFEMLSLVAPRDHVLDGGTDWRNLANKTELSLCGLRRQCSLMSNYFDHLLKEVKYVKCSQLLAGTNYLTVTNKSKAVFGNHWLSGSASPVLTATGAWETAIFGPLQNRHPLTDRQKICYGWLSRRPLQLCQIWCTSALGGFWANGWNITEFFLFMTLFTGTHLQVRRVSGFSRMMAQTTRTRARMCLFGASLTLLPI